MNHIFRLIFNRALGVVQVTSELVGLRGTGSSGNIERRSTARLRPMSFGLWLGLGWIGLVMPVGAQQSAASGTTTGAQVGRIVGDRDAPASQRPTVISAPNGTPLVNITTPSASGVSRNVYSRFDVDAQGAILNNSRTNVQTQLGGWIQGNPLLATGTARIILNEVNSVHPSHLNGYIEVGGQRAEVIIANPAGIQVDGGGFLNVSAVTLTTGKPMFNAGALDHYRVAGGAIGIGGAGLDASQTDYTSLISRSVEVNAGIWASVLAVTAGANAVPVGDGQVTTLESSGDIPRVAIDVGRLGGMYAGKITLVGTEHGVGVRNAGSIGAQAGGLSVSTEGRLENSGNLQSLQDAQILAAGGVANSGVLSAGRELVVVTSADVDNSGGTLNAMRVQVDAAALRNREGAIEQVGIQALDLDAGAFSNRDGGRVGDIESGSGEETGGDNEGPGTVPGGGDDPGHGSDGETGGGDDTPPPAVALDDGALNITGLLDNDGGRISAGGGIALDTDDGLDNTGGRLGLRNLTIGGGDLLNQSGQLEVSDAADLNVGELNNDAGSLRVDQALSLHAGAVSNRTGRILHGGTEDTTITVTGTLDNTDGVVATNAQSLSITAGVLVNTGGAIQQSGTQGLNIATGRLDGNAGSIATAGTLTLSATDIAHREAAISATQITLSADSFDNSSGEIVITGTGANTIDVLGELDNTDGTLASNGDLSLAADAFVNTDGHVQQAEGELEIVADTLDGEGGTLVSNGSLSITGETTNLRDGITSAQRIAIDTGDLTTAGGRLSATGTDALVLRARGTLDNTGGSIGTNGAAWFDTANLVNDGGNIIAAGDAPSQFFALGTLSNRDGGTISSAGDLALSASALENRDGNIEQVGEGALRIDADIMRGAGGSIVSAGDLSLTGEHIDLQGGTTQARRITVDAGSLATADGQLVSTGDDTLQLQVREMLDNDRGAIVANGALDLDAGALSNRGGALTVAGDDDTTITVAGMLDNTDGTLATNAEALEIAAGYLVNERGVIHQSGTQGLHITTGQLDGNAGTIAIAGALTLSAADIAHREAAISATQVTLDAVSLDNSGGQIVATGSGANTFGVSGTLDNTDGTLASNGDLSIAAQRLVNTDGLVQQAGESGLLITADTLDGEGGTLVSNGGLTITGETTNLRDGITSAHRITIDASDLTTAGGQLLATGTDALTLNARGTLDTNGGTIGSNGALHINAHALDNQLGILQAAGEAPSRLNVATGLDNRGGTLSFNGDADITTGELRNAGGTVLAAGYASLELSIDGLLDNSVGGRLAAGGDLSLAADILDNRAGNIEQAGEEGELTLAVETLHGAGGSIASAGDLSLTGEHIDLQEGSTQARRITVDAGSLTTADGQLVSTGDAALQLRVRDRLDNDRGTIAANGALRLDAGELSNRDGVLTAAGSDDTNIIVTDILDNTDGTLATNAETLDIAASHLVNERGAIQQSGTHGLNIATGRLDGNAGTIAAAGALTLSAADIAHREAVISAVQVTLSTSHLDNAGGQIVATGTDATMLDVSGTLDNTDGTLASNGNLSIAARQLVNVDGLVQQAGEGELEIVAGTLDGEGGALVSNGGLTITGETTNLRDGITSAHRIAIDTGDLTTAGGTLSATGTDALVLRARGTLDNSEGTIGSNGALDISVDALDNRQGVMQAAGEGGSRLEIDGHLDNRDGTIATAGSVHVAAATLDNRAGMLHAAGADASRIDVDGLLDNRDEGVIATSSDLSLAAAALDNRGGIVGAGGALDIDTTSAIDNAGGLVQAAQSLSLAGNGLHNAGGTIVGGEVRVDTRGHALDNAGGTLASTEGALHIRSGALHNTAGLVQSSGHLSIDTNGQTLVNSDSDTAGGLVSGAGMDIASGDLDNRGGMVFAQGDAAIDAGAIDNTGAGVIGSATDLALRGVSLSNSDGVVQAGGDASVALGGLLDNRAGLVAAGQALHVEADAIDNRDTAHANGDAAAGLQAAQLHVEAGRLDNRRGLVLADDAARIELTGLLDNADGQVASGGTLDIGADTITNTGGTLLSGDDQRIEARAMSGDGQVLSQGDLDLDLRSDFDNTGGLAANGTVALTTTGGLRNRSLLQGGHLDLRAVSIDNAASGEIASVGLTSLQAHDTLTNRGLIDGVVTHLDAAAVDNLGTGRIYGDHVAIRADALRNRAETIDGNTRSAAIAARERLDIGVGALANTGDSLIYSDGDAAIGGSLDADRIATGMAQIVDNLGSTIEIAGDLHIRAQEVNNIREGVAVTQTTTAYAPVRLDQPDWRNNGGNSSSDIRSTSNYDAYEVYYLHPDDILEDTPWITPDGYGIRRAVVRLTPETSAYFFGRGGLGSALGERSRLDVEAGTVTLHYFGRQDNQVNPDQVAVGADDPFTEVSEMPPGGRPFSYVDDNLTYSNAYGTCTSDCVQLWAQYAYADPDDTLILAHRGADLGSNEQYRIATRSVTEDVLAAGIGTDAVINAGGHMRIETDALLNRHARIAAGGDLLIQGLSGDASVVNIGHTLYRTHSFSNVTHLFNDGSHVWSNPDISEVIGQIGGSITSGGALVVDVGDLSNLNEGRDAPNVLDSASVANLDPHAAGSATDPDRLALDGPGAINGHGAEHAQADGPQRVVIDADGAAGPVSGSGAVSGQAAGQAVVEAPDSLAIATVDALEARTVNGATATQAADGSPDTIVAVLPDASLPTASLFNVQPSGGDYLVETDPRFADYRNWLGSDYLFDALGFDPATMHRRLGDGYYEQRLVREQVGELTGRRFLTGYASDEEQFRALMDAGAMFAQVLGLRPGVALSAEQMAQLTSDIVWLVEQTVTLADGSTQTVLVPQVYLRLRPGDLNDSGALLAGADVHLNLRGDLVNRGDIAGRQLVSINADNIHHLAGGTISGQAVGLQAAQDINILGASVTAADALSVQAGGDITVASTTQTLEGGGFHQYSLTSIDRVAGLYVTTADGLGVLSVSAGGDVTLQAAQIQNAGVNGLTQIAAVGNVNLTTLATGTHRDTTVDARNHHRTSTTTHVGTTVQGAGHVVLQAEQDIDLTAAQLQAGNVLALQAGGDLVSRAVVDSATLDSAQSSGRSQRAVQATGEAVRGSTLQAGSDTVLQAGNDLTLQAATVVSETGGIALSAGRDISLTTASETYRLQVDETRRESGVLSSRTTTTHDRWDDSYAVGTTISGETVQIAAGRDITAQAAQIVGSGDVLLAAGRDIDIGVGENTHSESHDSSERRSGLMGSGGIGFTIGTRQTETTADIDETTQTGSLIGSLDGRVDIMAGGDVTVIGSEVISQAGIGIVGQNVTIQAAENSTAVTETQRFRQSGINVSLSGGAVDTAMAVRSSVQRAGEVQDDRLAALHVARAGQALFSGGANSGLNSLGNTGNQLQALGETASTGETAGGSGLSLRVGIGASSSDSQMDYSATTSSGSRIVSAGDVVVHATGDSEGHGGDVTIIGSQVEGDNVTLAAARDLLLQSQRETSEQIERNRASSGEIGVTIGAEAGIGVYVSASGARGSGDGNSGTHAETTIDAANTLTLISGRNTTLEGAQARGNTVLADIGGDLTLTSQQDTSEYERRDRSAGIDVAVGTGGGSVSANYSQSSIDSTYTSVREQTGIQAGAGGFDITVGGHTELTGAAIASTADGSLNRLSTGSLSATDLENRAEYEAGSVGFSASGGTRGGSFTPSIGMPQSEEVSSTTRSGIRAGVIEIRDGDTSALATLDRSVTRLQQDGLAEIFDQRAVQERMEMGQVAGDILGTYYDNQVASYEALIGDLRAQADAASEAGEVERANRLYQQAAALRTQRDDGKLPQALVHTGVGLGLSLLTGSNTLTGNLQYGLQMLGVHGTDAAASAAVRQYGETQAIAFTCLDGPAAACANIKPPKDPSVEGMMAWAREHNIQITFLDRIPEGAQVIATNGILNNEQRAGQLAFGHAQDDTQDATIYLQHYATGGLYTDLLASAWSTFVAPRTGGYSATAIALADAVERQGAAGFDVLAHSRGTIETRNALNILEGRDYRNSHDDFDIVVVGTAVSSRSLIDPLRSIIGADAPLSRHLTYLNQPGDFMPTILGGSFLSRNYAPYSNPNDQANYIGIVRGQFWRSLWNLPSLVGADTVHNSYINNNRESNNNWNLRRADEENRRRLGLPSIPQGVPATPTNANGEGGQ